MQRITAFACLSGALALSSCQSSDDKMQDVHDKVAADAVAQYDMVAAHGSAVDKCVHAGLVSAAYLQAQREDEYRKWKTIEDGACLGAGVMR